MIPLYGRSWIMDHDETLQVVREPKIVGGGVDYEDGKPVKGQPLGFVIRANVQPLTGPQLLLVPEHDRYSEQFMIWSPELANTPKLEAADKIVRAGRTYLVQEAKDWGSYVEARMVRLDVGPDATGQVP